ncbi:FadR family transcriptional regulator [Seohaeicola saemankumensis]|nr:FadR/GntR family transcriptional regulator [Seohaeicola saemankumensis]MCA0872982.1 FadR family transcriptional regulator [Seohaeicola saemankumensis]
MPETPAQTSKPPRRNLTQEVVEALRKRIHSGELVPGDKLPTEQMLIAEYGVSRTVIREAISGLKADGLLNSRQGAGVFVQEPSRQDEAIALLSGNPKTIASVIEALELRAAVEIGAAELAAQRCSPAQEAEIFSRFSAFRQKVLAGERSEDEDFAFHVAIAEATNNRRFVDFLTLMGRNTIPRSELREKANLNRDPDLENRILAEHKALTDAIADRKPEAAREAMRVHLNQSAERYRVLARKAQEK